MLCHIIYRFLTRTHNIVHFGLTLNMLEQTAFCVYMYIHNHTYIHIQHTYIPIYRQTHIHTYLYIHTHTYLHTYMYILACILIYICTWLSSVYPSWSRSRGLRSSFLSPLEWMVFVVKVVKISSVVGDVLLESGCSLLC